MTGNFEMICERCWAAPCRCVPPGPPQTSPQPFASVWPGWPLIPEAISHRDWLAGLAMHAWLSDQSVIQQKSQRAEICSWFYEWADAVIEAGKR